MSIFGDVLGGILKPLPIVGGIYSNIEKGIEGDKIAELAKNRPKYTRPAEITQYLENAKSATTTSMPGYDLAKQNIDQSMASGMSNVKNVSDNPANSLAAIQNLAKSQMNMYSNLAVQNAQFHQTEKDKLANALKESAKYSDQEFEYNQNQPWQFNMNWEENKYSAAQQDAKQNTANTYALASNLFGGGLLNKTPQNTSSGYGMDYTKNDIYNRTA
jgi:hypothetical protein